MGVRAFVSRLVRALTPIVAQIFVFFGFLGFSRWFCLAIGWGALIFLVFSGF